MKKFFSGLTQLSIGLLILGIGLIALNFTAFIASFSAPISFEDLVNGTEVKVNSRVAGNMVASLPSFASESTTQYRNGVKGSTNASGAYYLVPTANGFLTLKTNQKQVSQVDGLVQQTMNWLEGKGEINLELYMEGLVKPMEKDVARYFTEEMKDYGYSQDEVLAMGDPLFIDYTDFGRAQTLVGVSVVLIAVGCFLAFSRGKKLERQKLEQQRLEEQEQETDGGTDAEALEAMIER